MGLSKYSYKYLNCGKKPVISIVTLFITIVTKSLERQSSIQLR